LTLNAVPVVTTTGTQTLTNKSLTSPTLTGTVTVPTPVNGTDASTKAYVDSVVQGLDIHPSARAASTATVSVTYTAAGGTSARGQITAAPNTLDGVTLAAGNRLLLKNQSTAAQNGIYVVTTLGSGATGVWDRATDFDSDVEVTAGAFVFVEEGTTNADTGWVLTTNNPITLGGASGTNLVFTQFSGAGTVVAGNGLTQSGNSIDVAGTTNRISVAADSIDISSAYVGQSTITTLGTVTTGTWNGTAIAVANGGTGSTTAGAALTALGAAPLASPTFTGTVTVPTPVNGTDATTKTYVDAQIVSGGADPNLVIMDAY
jgi:hypothetical protein